jgi:hypothetical protein
MSHIFISYSKQNIDFVRYLRVLLENVGFAVWVDEARLSPSARWWKTIEDSIQGCAAFVIVMSPDSVESDWVEREILLAEKLKRPIFPVLLEGDPWSRLANIQFEDMRAGLRSELSSTFVKSLRRRVPLGERKSREIDFSIEWGDVTAFECDVMAFKYAASFHGADSITAQVLESRAGILPESLQAHKGEYRYVDTGGSIPAQYVVYVGTGPLRGFGYKQIREFAASILKIVREFAPATRHLAMTLHGPGRALDEAEALLSQFAGLRDAMLSGDFPPALERITIVEIKQARVEHLRTILDDALALADYAAPFDEGWGYRLALPTDDNAPPAEPLAIETAGAKKTKPHAFVAMPAEPDFEDLFYFGILAPVHARGLLCERLDPDDGIEDQLDQIRTRIDSAAVVVADLTGADPRVYLQLGYAWGKGRPTILVIKDGQAPLIRLPAAPIIYKRIKDLESALAQQLDTLRSESQL